MSADEQVEAARRAPTVTDQDLVAEVAHDRAVIEWTERLDVVARARGRPCRHARRVHRRSRRRGRPRGEVQPAAGAAQPRRRGHRGAPRRGHRRRPRPAPGRRAALQRSRRPGAPRRPRRASPARCSSGASRCWGSAWATRCSAAPSAPPRRGCAFGHHGGNHPVGDEERGTVRVTSHNHEFQVDAGSIPPDSGWYVSERNLNDQSVEGLRHRELPAFSVQYHPEGAPGPQDRAEVFDEFLRMCRGIRSARRGDGGRPACSDRLRASRADATRPPGPRTRRPADAVVRSARTPRRIVWLRRRSGAHVLSCW